MKKPRGILVLETLIAIFIGLVVLGAIIHVTARQRQSDKRFAQVRAGMRALEEAMLGLQSGHPLPPDIRCEKLPDSAPDHAAWIRLSTTDPGGITPRQLIGLVRVDALPGGRP